MINITNLTKIYRSRKRSVCRALDRVNLTLPDAGLVFVLGKSGSGKSTLLNLIGGLDSITEGRITVDGNDLSTFREKDFCNYRNTHIGFIFQDYHLIDELTVYDNILLSLDLRRIEDGDRVRAALAKVDLAGYEDRYPSELSGGERQRIAIARAIVKNPRIILADEPTGNLDTNTATAIIELLRNLSEDCLILVVSHNLNDANKYADRIVELSHGRIIGDRTRNPEFLDEVSLRDGELVYPAGLVLSAEDVRLMNANKDAEIVRKTDKYLPTVEPRGEGKKVAIENKRLTLGKSLRLSSRFLKNKAFTISLSSFMVAVIMVIMAFSQTIINFDAGEVIAKEMLDGKQNSLLLSKTPDKELQELTSSNYIGRMDEGDMQAFYDAGYEGKIYQGLNYGLPITSTTKLRGYAPNLFLTIPYVSQAIGTLVVDEEFLTDKFGEDLYCARRGEFHPQGLIITDYLADAILSKSDYVGQGYDDLIQWGYSVSGWTLDVFLINAIIKTDYQETHKALFDNLEEKKKLSTSELYEDPDFERLALDVYDHLGYCYTTNPDFLEEYIAAENWRYPWYFQLVFENGVPYKAGNYYIRDARDNGSTPAPGINSWWYTETPPEIPEGARYMRVYSYAPVLGAVSKHLYGEKLSYPILAFDNGLTVGSEAFAESQPGCSLRATGKLQSNNNQNSIVSDFIEIPENAKISSFLATTAEGYAYCAFYDADQNFISSEPAARMIDEEAERTIYLPKAVYEVIFPQRVAAGGADWVENFVPHQEKLSHFALWDIECEDPLFEAEVTVQLNSKSSVLLLSEDLFTLFYKDSIFPYALYFDGTEGIGAAVELAEKMNYEYQSLAVEAIHTMTKAVDVFVPIFELVAIILCVGVVFILVNFATRMIKDKLHEIGILKAIGTQNSTVGLVFGLQILLIALLTCFMATVGYSFFIGMANDVLVESLSRLAPGRVMLDLEFLTFKPRIALLNCVLILLLSILSLAVPMIKIKCIRPVQIIKAKE